MYYFKVTNRRRFLNKLQEKYQYLYRGIVLDIGGRDRGLFQKPKAKVKQWIFADIEAHHKPDLVLDVANMDVVDTNSIDVVNAIELFEHVEKIEDGLLECYRVLCQNGTMLLSVPFLYPIHADPYDFQRWTAYKWKQKLTDAGFVIEELEVMGRFFSVLGDAIKNLIKSLPLPLKYIGYCSFPILDLLSKLDNSSFVLKRPKLANYHGGYFIVCRKAE